MNIKPLIFASLTVAITALSARVLANNNLFLPGDAFFPTVLNVCAEVGDIDYRIMSSDGSGVRMKAIVASYEPAAEWDHFDDGTFSAYDTITLQVVSPERHAGATLSVTVPPTELPEDSAFRTAGTRFTFTVRESDIGARSPHAV